MTDPDENGSADCRRSEDVQRERARPLTEQLPLFTSLGSLRPVERVAARSEFV